MRQVRQISTFCAHAPRKIYGILHQHVAVMGLFPSQGVDDKRLNARKKRHLFVADGLHVSDISQRTYAVTEDG